MEMVFVDECLNAQLAARCRYMSVCVWVSLQRIKDALHSNNPYWMHILTQCNNAIAQSWVAGVSCKQSMQVPCKILAASMCLAIPCRFLQISAWQHFSHSHSTCMHWRQQD